MYALGQLFGVALLAWIAYDLAIRQPRKKREARAEDSEE
jgi:hypothetical protein